MHKIKNLDKGKEIPGNMIWSFKKYSSNIACIDEEGNKTNYDELSNASLRFSQIIRPRSLVFSFCENVTGSLVGYVSFLTNNIVPLLLDSNMDIELIHHLIETYKPSFIWLPEYKSFLDYEVIFSDWRYNLLKTNLIPYTLNDELALLVTTSGSTGSPKLVRQSYKNLESNTDSIIQYLKIDSTERPITTLPMNYVYGASIINTHLLQGATILLTTKALVQKEFWQFLKEYNATSIAGVPYTYEMLEKLRFYKMELPSLRSMTQAGGKLHPDLHKKFAEFAETNGLEFTIMYGAAEATARMGYLPSEKALEKYGCMGIAIPGGRFELIDDSGNIINNINITGELVYYGENVTLGYAECGDDLIKGDERNGRYKTGDLATCDKDGYYTIVGRKNRFLKLFGNRVGLDETERMLNNAFPDFDCACSGVDDKITVFITKPQAGDSVIKFLSEKTSIHPSAFKIKIIPVIPRNESGKIQYNELRIDD